MKTLKQLKAFLDSLSDEQLEAEVVVHGEIINGFGYADEIKLVKAKSTLYHAWDYFGLYTAKELKENGYDAEKVAVKKGNYYFVVKFA